ncbi:DUF1592 domain-containing protein [Planctomycetes bacterium TBK1r]|uniref:Planctomycete cytochrome C n=1 Tax=Stieleria magnilauensis TaxID=2527963 RepID=A0ABX5XYX7_9BACT|nr:Planctomycete cytochrome C [Planctomycetes bacterium TBK1r]
MTLFKYILGIAVFWSCSLVEAAPPEARLHEKHRAFFKTYCLDCHHSEAQEGKVDLETLPLSITNLEQAELWQKVLNALNAGEMPPEDTEQPGNTEKADFLDDLARTMVTARQTLSDSGGKITMRRLNRREYRNTIKQLTGATVNADSLPNDGGSGTFDTVGASQFISSDQFEQYLKLGRSSIDQAFERQAALVQEPRVFRVDPETTVNVESLNSMRKMEETNDRFMRWKAGVDRAAAAPENRKIVASILKENPKLDLSAWPSASAFLFYRHAHKLNGAPDPKAFGFRDDNDATFSFQGGYSRKYAYMKHYAELPHSDRGTYLKLTWGIQRIDVSPKPKDLPPGTYRMRVRAGVVEGSPSYRHFIQIGHPQRVNQVPAGFASLPISSHQVTGTVEQPEVIETQLEVGLHTPKEFGIQERQPTDGKSLRDAYNRDKRTNGYGTPPAIWIDWIELEGPLPESGPPSPLRTILDTHLAAATHSEAQRARALLTDFADAAFRKAKPDATFIDKLVAIFEVRRKAGESFEVAIRTPLSVILASPGFLYLSEPGSETQPRQLDDRELAVRLAYFLWSAPPDEQLLDLAQRGELREPEILREQVDRMIADPRSDELVSGFVHQWLDMERLDFFQFDVALHREFDENTRAAAREEVYKSFAHLMRDKRNGRLGKLLKSDYVFINGLLATYYGIDGVAGDEFHQVKLPAGSPRGGLMGMAAIHAMGSDGVVSSPVERGAWVLRHLLNDPPPPAPPNVPQISRLEGQVLTTRERLLAHQEEAQCASCHRKIDPIGFGLENWGAAGKWRTEDSYQVRDGKGRGVGKRRTWAIDASGAFHKGPEFNDYHELRDLIAQREEDFARGFTEHLIEYALGRPFGFTDEDLANDIVRAAQSKEFPVSEFIHALVQSRPFQSK